MYPQVHDLAVFAIRPGTLTLGTVSRVWDRPAADPYVTLRTCDQRPATFVRSVSTITVISLAALAAALRQDLTAAAAKHDDTGLVGTPA